MDLTEFEINSYKIQISNNLDISNLEKDWLHIEAQENVPFFLSWKWISCWLKTYSPEVTIVKAIVDLNTVAIGLFTRAQEKRHRFIKSSQYRLHQTGIANQDQIWIEYNDIISFKPHKLDAFNACIKGLMKFDDCDEVLISMMPENRAIEVLDSFHGAQKILEIPGYSANLSNAKLISDKYLTTLNRNTRYQINRSVKIYKNKYGSLALSKAMSSEEALKLFYEAGELHKERWTDSGYNNTEFVQFHVNLIKDSFQNVDLIKISAGKDLIAILYFLKINQTVYFYLQGIKYEDDKKLKPGLVAHSLASQYYMDQNLDLYDYMGGYSQYKKQLAAESVKMVSIKIQKPKLIFKLENFARSIKNKTYNNFV